MNPRVFLWCAVTFICSLAPLTTSAVVNLVGCSIWTSSGGAPWLGDPPSAASYMLNCCSGFGTSQLPITVAGCESTSVGPVRLRCSGNTALGQPTSQDASGYTPLGSNGFHWTVSGLEYCAFNTDFEPKNFGPPPCPNCGNPQGNPVNIGIGNKYLQETDLASTGEGGLEFTRTYNALTATASEVGTNWTHTWARSLFNVGTAEKHAFRADGKNLKFVLSGSQWVTDADLPYQLAAIGTEWQLITPDDEIEIYSAAGKLLSVTSRSGKTTTLSYTDGTGSGANGAMFLDVARPASGGLLLRVTDFSGRSITFQYNSTGKIARMLDPGGNTYLYTYGTNFILSSVQYPDSSIRTYLYNESANTSGANIPYALTGIVDENGARYATYKYSTDKKAISTEHAGASTSTSSRMAEVPRRMWILWERRAHRLIPRSSA